MKPKTQSCHKTSAFEHALFQLTSKAVIQCFDGTGDRRVVLQVLFVHSVHPALQCSCNSSIAKRILSKPATYRLYKNICGDMRLAMNLGRLLAFLPRKLILAIWDTFFNSTYPSAFQPSSLLSSPHIIRLHWTDSLEILRTIACSTLISLKLTMLRLLRILSTWPPQIVQIVTLPFSAIFSVSVPMTLEASVIFPRFYFVSFRQKRFEKSILFSSK